MEKVNIKLITIGHMPIEINKQKLINWKSKVFKIDPDIPSYTLPIESDGYNWDFSDENIKSILPDNGEFDIRLVIVNVPLEEGYYARRLCNNTAVITFHMMSEILHQNNIPLQNLILRVLYAYSLVYIRYNKNITDNVSTRDFTHDETRSCIFDMTGIKYEVIYSAAKPILCESCIEASKKQRVSNEILNHINKELKRIRKSLYFRIIDKFKRHPIISLIITTIFAIGVGVIGNILSSFII